MAQKTMMWLIERALDALQKIPASFWGIIIGSMLTLSGVILTNRASDRRARAQFLHDQTLHQRERELGLRKEIYLAATEALSAGLRAVPSLANLDLSYDQIVQPYVEKGAVIAKVHIIATEETLTAVAAISSALQGEMIRLTAKRIPLMHMKTTNFFFEPADRKLRQTVRSNLGING
jgi:hypothetical protein